MHAHSRWPLIYGQRLLPAFSPVVKTYKKGAPCDSPALVHMLTTEDALWLHLLWHYASATAGQRSMAHLVLGDAAPCTLRCLMTGSHSLWSLLCMDARSRI